MEENIATVINTDSPAAIQIMNYLDKKIGGFIDWTSENIIPYIQDLISRYIHYRMITSILGIIALIGLLFVIKIIGRKIINYCRNEDWEIEFIIVIIAFISIGVFVLLTYEIVCLIKCFYLPEMIIYDAITSIAS